MADPLIQTPRLTLHAASQEEMRRVLGKCAFAPTGSTGEEGPRFVRLP